MSAAAAPMADGVPVPPPVSAAAGADPTAIAASDPYREARRTATRELRRGYAAAVAARTTEALVTPTLFVERLVHFWANHFAVSADKLEMVGLACGLEFEAIRPHVLGRFADMLLKVERHPAMLIYLDQAVSVGSESPVGAAAMLFGGRVKGGRMVADWPGLGTAQLHEARDLRPTMRLDALIDDAVAATYDLEPPAVGSALFPAASKSSRSLVL